MKVKVLIPNFAIATFIALSHFYRAFLCCCILWVIFVLKKLIVHWFICDLCIAYNAKLVVCMLVQQHRLTLSQLLLFCNGVTMSILAQLLENFSLLVYRIGLLYLR